MKFIYLSFPINVSRLNFWSKESEETVFFFKKVGHIKTFKNMKCHHFSESLNRFLQKLSRNGRASFCWSLSFCSSVLSVSNQFVRVKQDTSNRWSTTCKWSSAYGEKVFPVSRFSTYFPRFSSTCPLGNSKNFCAALGKFANPIAYLEVISKKSVKQNYVIPQ